MSLIGERFQSSDELCGGLGNCYHDFWVSGIAGATPREYPECVQSVKVEGYSAWQAVTHCFFIESEDIRGTSDYCCNHSVSRQLLDPHCMCTE